jgi:GNAT superfamily N-acetyltransferase
MIKMTLDIIRDYLQGPENLGRRSDSVAPDRHGEKENVVTGMGAARPSSTSTVRCRNATAADAPALAQMNRQLVRDEGHRNRMPVNELEQRMRSWLDGEYQAVVFEDEQGAAGYALYKREAEWVYVRQFFVQSERRRQGIGRAALAWLRENSWRESAGIRLDVLIGNAGGIQFWRSMGFEDYCITMERANQP